MADTLKERDKIQDIDKLVTTEQTWSVCTNYMPMCMLPKVNTLFIWITFLAGKAFCHLFCVFSVVSNAL